MKPSRLEREGMALLTVLLLVAVMAALSVVMLDDIRFSVRRATNASATPTARDRARNWRTPASLRASASPWPETTLVRLMHAWPSRTVTRIAPPSSTGKSKVRPFHSGSSGVRLLFWSIKRRT